MAFSLCYVWQDLDAVPAEQKFGDHFSIADNYADAVAETTRYIRGTLGRQKHKFDNGRVIVHKIWDVSEYAKLKGKFYPHAKVDDVIRPVVPGHIQADVHQIDANTLITNVNQELIRHKQTLPIVGLSINQLIAAKNVLTGISNGRRTIVAELCARFGKTIWSGVLVKESSAKLTIIASYVLTSFASFKKDLTSFQQFKDFVLVDSKDADYQEQIAEGLANGQQVVVFISMCSGGKRQVRIDHLFGINLGGEGRLVIVDEADFGVHRANQAKPLIDGRSSQDVVILMTGTNGDKAAGIWPVDHYLSVTYPELLIERHHTLNGLPIDPTLTPLKHFAVDYSRHLLTVLVQFYQMGLGSLMELAKAADPGLFVENGIYAPSWSKYAADPTKAKGFFVRMLQAVFEGKHGVDALNIDLQTRRNIKKEGTRVAMMFLSGSITNEKLAIAVAQANEALSGFVVIQVNGDTMTNATAEKECKEIVAKARKDGKSVLLLSAGMAQRSFSIPEITELYLAYDTGDNGATIQKMSRTLTPDTAGKIGRIVSLSFDPNRDDKFDAMMVEAALNYQKTHGLKDTKAALREVLRTVDVFRCLDDGAVKIEVDEYLEAALSRNSIDRVVGKTANLDDCSPEMILAIAAGKSEVYKAAQVAAAAKGKTHGAKAPVKRGANPLVASKTEMAKAREVLVTISQNMDIIRYYGGANLDEAFALIDVAPAIVRDGISMDFGVDYELIKTLIATGRINRNLLDLKFA